MDFLKVRSNLFSEYRDIFEELYQRLLNLDDPSIKSIIGQYLLPLEENERIPCKDVCLILAQLNPQSELYLHILSLRDRIRQEFSFVADLRRTESNQVFEKEKHGPPAQLLAALLEAAEKIRPNSVCFRKIGQLYLRQGDFQKAQEWFEKALVINPLDPAILYQFGLLYQKMGKMEKALRLFQNALALRPLNENHIILAIKKIYSKVPPVSKTDSESTHLLQEETIPPDPLPEEKKSEIPKTEETIIHKTITPQPQPQPQPPPQPPEDSADEITVNIEKPPPKEELTYSETQWEVLRKHPLFSGLNKFFQNSDLITKKQIENFLLAAKEKGIISPASPKLLAAILRRWKSENKPLEECPNLYQALCEHSPHSK